MLGALLSVSLVAVQADVVLPIPGRRQWDNSHGYCGSCSLQQAGLFFGNWISQDVARKSVGNKELLPGVNEAKAAKKLKFSTDVWNGGEIKSKSQYRDYMVWVRGHLLQRHPVVMTFYLSGYSDSDYDHIMPAIGIKTAHDDSAYHADDVLIINNNYQRRPISHSFDDFKGTRKSCNRTEVTGGCIPERIDYGVAVQGVMDEAGETLPLRLSVDRWDEPNVATGSKSANLTGRLEAHHLAVGRRYLLLRYAHASQVPTSHFASAASRRSAQQVVHFTADRKTWRYTDPLAIPSGGSAFYRLVQVGDGDDVVVV